jgi:hypothetical protein
MGGQDEAKLEPSGSNYWRNYWHSSKHSYCNPSGYRHCRRPTRNANPKATYGLQLQNTNGGWWDC